MSEGIPNEKPAVSFCDVKGSSYQGFVWIIHLCTSMALENELNERSIRINVINNVCNRCGKRSFLEDLQTPSSTSASPPVSKKLLCSSSTSPVRFPPSTFTDQLRNLFPDMDSQLAFPNAIYLVDAIQGGETLIKACKPALESTYITKVIHDCKRDSEALYFQFGIKLIFT